MAVTTPSRFAELSIGDYATTEDAFASEWKDLVHNGHYQWSIQIAKLDGHVFFTPWDQTSTTYQTSADSSGLRDLDTLNLASRLRRVDGSSNLLLHIEAAMEHLELRATVDRLNSDDTTTQIGQASVLDSGGTLTWSSIDFTFSEADVSDAGSASNDFVPIQILFEGKVDSDGNTGKLYHVHAWEAVAESRSTIP